jgi:uncharacterized protein (TIGR02246 family)
LLRLSNNGIEPTAQAPYDATKRIMKARVSRIIVSDCPRLMPNMLGTDGRSRPVAQHPIELLIEQADSAIMREDFDAVMRFYADDAILVVEAGRIARGKDQIRRALEAIAQHFGHTLCVEQPDVIVLEASDTAVALARAIISAADAETVERSAIYVFRRETSGEWLCVIDNSYGHELLRRSE